MQISQEHTESGSAETSSQDIPQNSTFPQPHHTQSLPGTSSPPVPLLPHHQPPITPVLTSNPTHRSGNTHDSSGPTNSSSLNVHQSTTLVYTHNAPLAHPYNTPAANPPPQVPAPMNPSARPFTPQSLSTPTLCPPATSLSVFPLQSRDPHPPQSLLSILSQPIIPRTTAGNINVPVPPSIHPYPTVRPLIPPATSSLLPPAASVYAMPPTRNNGCATSQQTSSHSAPTMAHAFIPQTPHMTTPLYPAQHDMDQLKSVIMSAVRAEFSEKILSLEAEVSRLISLLQSHSLMLQENSALISSIPRNQQGPVSQVEASSHPQHYSSQQHVQPVKPANPHQQQDRPRASNTLPYRIVWGTQRNCSSQVLLKAICSLLPNHAWGQISVKRSVRPNGPRSRWWFTIMAPDEIMKEIVRKWNILESRTSWSLIQSLSNRPRSAHSPHPTQTQASFPPVAQQPATLPEAPPQTSSLEPSPPSPSPTSREIDRNKIDGGRIGLQFNANCSVG